MKRDYKCQSAVADYITGLVAEKRSLGYSYSFEEYELKNFDYYCLSKGMDSPGFDKDFLSEWMVRRPDESCSFYKQRVSFVRQLSLYMNTLGIPAYIPDISIHQEKSIPRFLNKGEINAFFNALDSAVAKNKDKNIHREWNEYRVAFRLLYSCGMRNNEVCTLKYSDVDLKKGCLTIRHSKGNKDRLIYMADDMTQLLKEYFCYLTRELGFCPQWFFPSRNPEKHIHKSTLCGHFNRVWRSAYGDDSGNKKPTVHSLRHSYVVNRMNTWLDEGVNFEQMMPYLSRYLGHKSPSETLYYYHLNEEANAIIRKKDKSVCHVIPEVPCYE